MDRGPSTSPVTGRPQHEGPGREHSAARREKNLKEKAGKLGVIESAAGQALQQIIEKRLLARVDALIKEDPEANSYRLILQDMGNMERMARKAVEELYKTSGVRRPA